MVVFFFQAEDGIRDLTVTGVQTCALPISSRSRNPHYALLSAAKSPRQRRRSSSASQRLESPSPAQAKRERFPRLWKQTESSGARKPLRQTAASSSVLC